MPEAAAGTPAAGTPAGTPAAGTPAAGTPAAGTPAAAAPAWHGFAETDTTGVEYVKNKGWQNSSDVIKSYQGAEKLIGRDPSTLLVVPRADDPAGIRAVQQRLGMPESAEKYDFGIPPEKINADFDKWARTNFHELGLTGTQAKEIVARYEKYGAEAGVKADQNYKIAVAADKQTLQREWGGGYERMMGSAQMAVRSLGMTKEMVDSLEGNLGYAGVMKYLAGLGQKFSEDGFVGGEHRQSGFGNTMTPAEATAEWEKMKADPVLSKALLDRSHPQHEAAKAKQKNLFDIRFPG